MEIERQNPHWAEDFLYPYEKKRELFEKIMSSINSGLITAVYGLRRVGKSILMKQCISDLIRRGIEREKIFYFSFDEGNEDFWEVIHAYEKTIGKRIDKACYLFLDEIQKIEGWRAKIKKLYDTSGAHITVTGSNSSLLRKGGESLAGRIYEFYMPELSFSEFLYFKGKENLIESSLKEAVELAFWEYIKKPFPELVVNEKLEYKSYTKTIARKIIYEDLPPVFQIDEPELLFTIFSLISKNPGMIVEYSSLASDLGRNRKTIAAYLTYLRYGFVVRQLFNYSKNALTSEKKLKKFYPSLACFVESDESKVVETLVAQVLKPRFFWNYKNRYEVDFIIEEPFIGFEVKYANRILAEDTEGLKQFNSAYPKAKTYMVTKKTEQNHIHYFDLEQFLKKNNIERNKLENVL